ncbi:hypothetical protein [Chondromyces apiculatus]|uniref:Glycosyltransferase RgtA/B/C/D-like domain-containing protein n=1 Tax=Chondromyces apiculatus DSM 436 TaxID=1192034 RepID=A0A017T1X9_9BACT|nr:hypothetical protein [Chondromyces apiculatus]EYF03274.1 Hypothetical protein CAP_5778 [Chondromyces apiculatus DSM 436]
MRLPGPPWRSPGLRDLGVVLAVKAAASAVTLGLGFRAVSDDDFARVVLAQAWAHAPKLDPTGTSWLPAPFWLSGALLRLFGTGLGAARAVALVLGLVSAALIYLAARWITEEAGAGGRRGALAGALVAAVFPWSARLGVATVPELPTAALTLLGVAALTTPSANRRLWGALALLWATLSRYEPWPLAAVFAAWSLLSALRLGQSRGDQAKLVVAALIALAGPAAWVAWNHVAHGDALQFLARVAAYRQALGSGGGDGLVSRLLAYPGAMLREEPELVLAPLALWLAVQGTPGAARFTEALRPYRVPAALASLQIAALSAALVRDGAPTHHPERATLVGLLVLALVVGDVGAQVVATGGPALRRRAGAAVVALLLVGGLFVRRYFRREHFNPRLDEVAVGEAAAARVPGGAPILLEVPHYGYFAVMAALGRPGQVVLDRSIDPRDPPTASSFVDAAALRRRLVAAGADWFVAQPTEALLGIAGASVEGQGAWALWSAGEVRASGERRLSPSLGRPASVERGATP